MSEKPPAGQDEALAKQIESIEEELRPVFNLSRQESHEFASNGLTRLFDKRLAHLDETDRAAIVHWVDKLVSYATYQPARSIADRLVEQVVSDSRHADARTVEVQAGEIVSEENSSGTAGDEQLRLFRKGA